VSGQLHGSATLPPRKDPQYPLDRMMGGPQSRSGQLGAEKILDPTGTLDPSVVHPVASLCTNYTILAPVVYSDHEYICSLIKNVHQDATV
jgi:hypothetical protein